MRNPDFSLMIFDIAAHTKMKDCQIAAKLRVLPSTLAGWKNSKHEPRYSHGAALIELHTKVCK